MLFFFHQSVFLVFAFPFFQMSVKALEDNPRQKLLCVDAKGVKTGRIIDRKTGHTAPGVKHLAIQELVFKPESELILHERPLKKVGGGVLDAPTTHVLSHETPEKAALRCLKDEYGIKGVKPSVLKGFSYEKDYNDGSCENQFCLAAFIVFGGRVKANEEHTGAIAVKPAKDVLEELASSPERFPVWFRKTAEIVAKDAK